MNVPQAVSLTGGLSNTSKMPGKSYGIPAWLCNVGSRLRKVSGSTCEHCYALKGMYGFTNVKEAQLKRFKLMFIDEDPEKGISPAWKAGMIKLIENQKWFRWHDSGDLQSITHFQAIIDICIATPGTKHWLPTREYRVVMDFICNGGVIPKNLCIRFSDHMIDRPGADSAAKKVGVCVSGVTTGRKNQNTCPAPDQGGECGDCRKCWNKRKFRVNYRKH